MNYISTYAEIIDENECLRGLNLYTDCSWSSDFLKLKACEYEWCKYGFYPINGMVGEIVGLVSSNIYSEPILILRILEMFYVPITSSGVKVISTSEHSIKKMSQIKQIDAHKEYVTKTKDNSFKVVWRDGKCGFINNRGCHITEFEFEIGTAFSDGRALIQRSDLWGFIDYEGREVIKATYHTARSFNENRAVVESVGWKAINRFGETTSKSYHFMCDYSHGLSAVCLKSYTGFNWGFVDKDGIEIIPIIYDRVFDFNNGFAIIYKDRKYGIINESGTLIVPPIYDKISGITDDYKVSASINNQYNILSLGNNLEINTDYDSLWINTDNLFCARKGGQYGFVNSENEIIIPFIYNYASAFVNGLAKVAIDNKIGYIDTKNNIVIPFIYDDGESESAGLLPVKKGNKWGCINRKGDIVIPFNLNDSCWFENNLATVLTEDEFWLINNEGVFIRKICQD